MAEKSKRFKIPGFYKTLIALIVVIGPITWLTFTEDGRRRTDLMVLGFQDAPMVEMRLDTLGSAATEEKVREFLPEVNWQCKNQRTAFGERNCITPLGAFNDTPAHYLVMYFEADALQAMKVVYRGNYHDHLKGLLLQMLGQPKADAGVLQWTTDRGMVMIQTRLQDNAEEPTLIWMSAQRVLKRSAEKAG